MRARGRLSSPYDCRMKTLHTAYRVRDLERSLRFYESIGFLEIGRLTIGDGSTLVMLNLPDDGGVVTLELVHKDGSRPIQVGDGFSHIAVQVEDLSVILAGLADKGVRFGELTLPAGPDGPKTSFVQDPDGYRLELVEWPRGHADGITRDDFRR